MSQRPALDLICALRTAKQVSRFDGQISAVLRPQFLHDIANMDFDGAFTHVQFVSDYLVRLALANRSADRKFARRDYPGGQRALCERWCASVLCKYAFRRNEDATRQDEAHRFDRDFKSHRHRDVTLRAMGKRRTGQFEIVFIGEDDYWYSRSNFRQLV